MQFRLDKKRAYRIKNQFDKSKLIETMSEEASAASNAL